MKEAKPLIATEGFKSKTTRVQALKIAKEDIKETAKQIWQAIVNAFNKAIAWVKDFFAKLFDGATKLKVRAEKLKKIAEGKKGEKAEAGASIDKPALAEVLRRKGVVLKAGEVKTWAENAAGGVTDKSSATATAEKIAADAEAVFAQVDDTAKFDAALVEFAKSFSGSGAEAKVDGLAEGLKATVRSQFGIGDKVGVSIGLAEVTADTVKQKLGSLKVIITDEAGRKPLVKTEMEVASPEDVVGIAAGVQKLAEALIKNKQAVDKIGERQKKVQDYAKRLSSSSKDDALKNARVAASLARVVLTATSSSLVQGNQFFMAGGNACLNYAAASLALAGKAAAPAAK